MNADLFTNWYKNDFIPEVRKFRERENKSGKVVLLLDNAPSHPGVELLNQIDENFEVRYLPPNVTSLIQPMDQGVIEKVKRLYRKDMLRRLLLSENNNEETVISLSKKLNLKDCSYMLADAWNSLTPENFRNAWNKLLGESYEGTSDSLDTLEADLNEMVDELFPEIPGFSECDIEDARSWFENDDPGFQILNDDEIVSTIQEESEDAENENLDGDDEEESGPSHGEAFTALETALSWFEKQEESCTTQLLLLKRMRDLAAKKRRANFVQKKISDYFSA